MNDRYFVMLGWVGLLLAVAVDRAEFAAAWLRREVAMVRDLWR